MIGRQPSSSSSSSFSSSSFSSSLSKTIEIQSGWHAWKLEEPPTSGCFYPEGARERVSFNRRNLFLTILLARF
ncbi:hypothetical protein PUN28_007372 [Cardiocondyla obscurior]|uniref:Uncharacterized protein n=1 Tax=Cardiocondyla obscurior TaxID=286306 RepID=A0AAW2G4V0_9HYME